MLSPSKVLQSDVMPLAEQNELKGAAWFQAGIPREICLEVLSRQHPGAFLVRKSSSKAGCFALSLRTPPPGPKVVHYLVLRTAKGYKIKVKKERGTLLIMFQFQICVSQYFQGFHKRVFISTYPDNPPFSDARTAAGAFSTSSGANQHTAQHGRCQRYLWVSKRLSKNDDRSKFITNTKKKSTVNFQYVQQKATNNNIGFVLLSHLKI
jgi:SH2 domain